MLIIKWLTWYKKINGYCASGYYVKIIDTDNARGLLRPGCLYQIECNGPIMAYFFVSSGPLLL